MPHKDPAALKAYKLAHSRLPAQRERQRLLRQRPGYEEYMRPFRRKNLLQRYGITQEDYEALFAQQGGRCAICFSEKSNNGKGDLYLDVDHCHTSGKVRGLLCRNCNVTVGVVEKKAELIKLIHAYLEKYK